MGFITTFAARNRAMEESPEIEATNSQRPKANSRIVQEDEIDLVELAKVIWSKRRIIRIFFATSDSASVKS